MKIRYPPGYPIHDYEYHVPDTSITFVCYRFIEADALSPAIIRDLLRRARTLFADPRQRNRPAQEIRHDDKAFEWYYRDYQGAVTGFRVWLPTGGDYQKITFGQMLDTIHGAQNMVYDWPKLTMACDIIDAHEEQWDPMGYFEITWSWNYADRSQR